MDTPPAEMVAGEAPALTSSPSNDFARPPRTPVFAPVPGGGWRRFGFRFVAAYLIIFTAGRVFGIVPGLERIGGWVYQFWRGFTPAFGRVVLRLKEPVSLVQSGSGDKLFDWVQAAATVALALLAALVWVWFDRRRRWDGWVHDLVRVAVRYSLGVTMLSYGLSKIFHQQMPAPSFYRLLETYGESSPMGMLWAFMGQSWAYSAFAGGLEFLGGFLLFFRRTTTLGALILVAVMTNVLLMNLCFDVPVKLYSAVYLFMACMLVAPDVRRLWDVLVRHRPTAPAMAGEIARPWPGGRAGRLFMAVKVLIVLWAMWLLPVQRTWAWLETPAPVKSAFYGLYEVESFTRDGEVRPPLLTDGLRWRRVTIDERNFFTVIFMTETRRNFRWWPGPKPDHGVLEMPQQNTAAVRSDFTFNRPAPNELVLEGKLAGATLAVKLRRVDDTKLLLQNRGFHWISERPFNR